MVVTAKAGSMTLVGALIMAVFGHHALLMAQENQSENYRLRGGSVTAGGAVGLRSGNPSGAVGSLGFTIGQASPVGSSEGAGTGTTLTSGFWPVTGGAGPSCAGDCNGDGQVLIDELVLGVTIALGAGPLEGCPALADMDGRVGIAQLVGGVNSALNECSA